MRIDFDHRSLGNYASEKCFTFTNIFKTIGKVLVFLPGFLKFPRCHHFVFLFINILSQEFLCRMAIPSRITTLSCRFDRNNQSVVTKCCLIDFDYIFLLLISIFNQSKCILKNSREYC